MLHASSTQLNRRLRQTKRNTTQPLRLELAAKATLTRNPTLLSLQRNPKIKSLPSASRRVMLACPLRWKKGIRSKVMSQRLKCWSSSWHRLSSNHSCSRGKSLVSATSLCRVQSLPRVTSRSISSRGLLQTGHRTATVLSLCERVA